MAELTDYEYEVDGKVVFFFYDQSGCLCARVNHKATYRQNVPGQWFPNTDPGRNNKLTSEQVQSVWERHVASLIVDGEPKSYDPWRKQWVTGEQSS